MWIRESTSWPCRVWGFRADRLSRSSPSPRSTREATRVVVPISTTRPKLSPEVSPVSDTMSSAPAYTSVRFRSGRKCFRIRGARATRERRPSLRIRSPAGPSLGSSTTRSPVTSAWQARTSRASAPAAATRTCPGASIRTRHLPQVPAPLHGASSARPERREASSRLVPSATSTDARTPGASKRTVGIRTPSRRWSWRRSSSGRWRWTGRRRAR
jgi:hypothetical protein